MMETFIASMIIKAADVDEGKGQDKYKAYFVKTRLYTRYKENVDTILNTDGYGNVIVEG